MAASNQWLCPPPPASACPRSQGKAALPLPGLEAVVSSSSVQACPRGFGCLSPRCLALAGSSSLLQQLKNWKKTGGKHPVYRHRAKTRCDGASHDTCVYPLLAKQAGGDRALWGRGAEETPSS